MAAFLEKAQAFSVSHLSAFSKKVQGKDPLAVGLAAVLVAGAAFGLYRIVAAPGDGAKYADEEQKALNQPFEYKSETGKVIQVQAVKRANIKGAAVALASGNASDPMVVASAKKEYTDAQREQALFWLSKVLLKSTVPTSYGAVVLQTAGAEATAVWFPNGRDVSFSALVYNGVLSYIFQYSGWDRRGRWLGSGEAIAAIRQRVMSSAGRSAGNYYHLLNIGAKKELADRESYLAAVVKPVTERADRTGRPCVVQTCSEEQRDLFQRLGWTLADQAALFKTTVFTLVRQPAGAAAAAATPAPVAGGAAAGSAASQA